MFEPILDLLHETPAPLVLATVLALVPTALAMRERLGGAPVGERTILWLLALPVVATGFVLYMTQIILDPPQTPKIDPRFMAFLRATVAIERVGPVLLLGALGALLAPALRRGALSLLPMAAALSLWSVLLRQRLVLMALSPTEEKLAIWTEWQALHGALGTGIVLIGAVTGTRSVGPARWVAVATLLPLLLWPGWVPWLLLVGP